LTIQILGPPANLIGEPLRLGFCIAGYPADALLNLAAEIARGSFDPVFIHVCLLLLKKHQQGAIVPAPSLSSMIARRRPRTDRRGHVKGHRCQERNRDRSVPAELSGGC
jgi:hypothetical protein